MTLGNGDGNGTSGAQNAFIDSGNAPTAATDGMPPNLQDKGVGQSVQIEGMTARSAPQYLHGQGEVSLVPNPAFHATAAAAPVRTGRIPPIRGYVGA